MNLKRTPEELLEQSLGLFKEPSTEAMESTGGRVRARLRTEVGNLQEEPTSDAPVERITGTPLWLAAAAVAVAAIAIGVGSGILPKANSTGDSRVSMDQIATHELFQSGNQFGKTLVLPEDSRVEMHAQTQLSFVRATDGLQILLNEGSILVSAAKQRTGHLYVKTKDLTVSVVGTVFLVKAEQDGSRVAVIEGEVHVEKGTTIETLLPGEQVATSTPMAERPVIEEISWSRHAEEHFAMVQQSAMPPVATAGGPLDRFEATSVRLGEEQTGSEARPGEPVRVRPCPGGNPFEMTELFQLNPGRLVMRRLPVYYLIGFAYGHSCPASGSLTGGPDWTRTSRYDLEATIPAGTPKYTKEQLLSGNAPQLQRMLQNLLADRFKLVLQREVKETQGYNLVLAREGKLKLSANQTPDQVPAEQSGRAGIIGIPYLSVPMSRLARSLQELSGRPVVDKTGLSGLYDVRLEFPEIAYPTPRPAGVPPSDIQRGENLSWVDQIDQRIRDLLPAKLEAATGLRLEEAKVPVEVLVIVNIERPSAN